MERDKLIEFKSKTRFSDALFLFRCGDYYKCYHEDADVLVTVLYLNKVDDCAGFPFHALDTYLPKLIRAGHRVAICE
jgi:DNA mismatch repair protein MutS